VCCPPLLRAPITARQAYELAQILKALAGSHPLRLVSMLAAHDGEACVCDLTAPLGPPRRRHFRAAAATEDSPAISTFW
jgi:hypothetical protein